MLVNSEVTIKGDFHCHTLASLHAYSTLRENLIAAQKRGLRLLAITDHGIGTPDSPPLSFFENLTSLPQNVDGIRLLRGVEANIMDHTGRLDIPDEVLRLEVSFPIVWRSRISIQSAIICCLNVS